MEGKRNFKELFLTMKRNFIIFTSFFLSNNLHIFTNNIKNKKNLTKILQNKTKLHEQGTLQEATSF